MGSGIYSNLKMAWHFARNGAKLPDAPSQVQLILSDLCQHDCHFCSYRWSNYSSNQMFTDGAELSGFGTNNPKRMIPTERALAMLDEFKQAGVKAVQYTGGGEPLLHQHHLDVFRKTLDIGLKAALVTNGERFVDGILDVLPKFEWVRVSLDAGTPVTYSKVRRIHLDRFDRTIRNLTSLCARVSVDRSRCVVGVGYVVTPQNWHEIIEGARLARECGAAYIRMSAMFSPGDEAPFANQYDRIREDIAEAKRRYDDSGFTVHDLFGDRMQDLVDHSPDYTACPYMYENTYVGGDQNVYTCCILAYNKRGLIGSIKTRSFAELWASDERKEFMAKWDSHGCPRCMYNEKNRIMNYLLQPEPAHVEFT